MKNMKSVMAAFTFAASVFGFGRISSAEAQTVPITPQYDSTTMPYQTPTVGTFVSQQSIDEVAKSYGVQTPYYRIGVGFTSGISTYGENVGLEFRLHGNKGTVVRAYNLNEPTAAEQFQASMTRAAELDATVINNNYYQPTSPYQIPAVVYPLPVINQYWFDPAYNNCNQNMFPSGKPGGGYYFYIPKK